MKLHGVFEKGELVRELTFAKLANGLKGSGMIIFKHKEEYVIVKNVEQLARVKTYRNPHHMSNC